MVISKNLNVLFLLRIIFEMSKWNYLVIVHHFLMILLYNPFILANEMAWIMWFIYYFRSIYILVILKQYTNTPSISKYSILVTNLKNPTKIYSNLWLEGSRDGNGVGRVRSLLPHPRPISSLGQKKSVLGSSGPG